MQQGCTWNKQYIHAHTDTHTYTYTCTKALDAHAETDAHMRGAHRKNRSKGTVNETRDAKNTHNRMHARQKNEDVNKDIQHKDKQGRER